MKTNHFKKRFKTKTADEFQDEIFRKMPISKKIRLTAEFSEFLLKLNQLNTKDEI